LVALCQLNQTFGNMIGVRNICHPSIILMFMLT
jgi:hypothetical protein